MAKAQNQGPEGSAPTDSTAPDAVQPGAETQNVITEASASPSQPGSDTQVSPEPPSPPPASQPKATAGAKKKIKNPVYAGMSVGGLHGAYTFDASGVAEVPSDEAARFLTMPGYSEA